MTSSGKVDFLQHTKKLIMKVMTKMWTPITSMVAHSNPIQSYKIPASVGPTNAPKANVDVHSPEIRP